MLQTSKSNSEAELIKLSFEHMLVQWGENTPLRTGLHASSVLVSDAEWCVREHVLSELFPEQGVKPEMHPWDWKREAIFENGWDLHKRWQKILSRFGKVVWSPISDEQASEIAHHLPPAMFKYYVKLVDGQWYAAELDLTHYDEVRNTWYSPDGVFGFGPQRYVMEIKGIKQEEFVELTNGLEQAMKVSQTVHKAYYQANLYMHLLQLKKAILLIENKNTQDFRVWVISYDREAALPYTARTENVKRQTAVTKRDGLSKLPQRICKSKSDARALKCPMRECCFKEEMEG